MKIRPGCINILSIYDEIVHMITCDPHWGITGDVLKGICKKVSIVVVMVNVRFSIRQSGVPLRCEIKGGGEILKHV